MIDLDKVMPQMTQAVGNHYVYGTAAGIVGVVGACVFHRPDLAPHAGFGLGCLAAGFKEGTDALFNWLQVRKGEAPTHGVQLTHALATVAGGTVVAAAALAINLSRITP